MIWKWQRNQRSNCQHIIEKAKNSRKTSTFAWLTMLKSLTVWITKKKKKKLWKILEETRVSDHLTCLLRNLYAGQEATVRTRHGTMTGSKLGKEYVKAVYCHPAYLTYMQSTSWEMLEWMNHSWNQDCREKYQEPQICRWHHSNGRKGRGTKEPLDECERGEWKTVLKVNIRKTKIMASSCIT